MGKGARTAQTGASYEAYNCATHGAPLGGDAYVNTVKNLGGDPENPFRHLPRGARSFMPRRAEELKKIVAARYAARSRVARKPIPEIGSSKWKTGLAEKLLL